MKQKVYKVTTTYKVTHTAYILADTESDAIEIGKTLSELAPSSELDWDFTDCNIDESMTIQDAEKKGINPKCMDY